MGRLGSVVRVSASFQNISHLVGRLVSGPRIVGRLGSVAWCVSARFQNISQLVGRYMTLRRGSVRVSSTG